MFDVPETATASTKNKIKRTIDINNLEADKDLLKWNELKIIGLNGYTCASGIKRWNLMVQRSASVFCKNKFDCSFVDIDFV